MWKKQSYLSIAMCMNGEGEEKGSLLTGIVLVLSCVFKAYCGSYTVFFIHGHQTNNLGADTN